MGYRMMYPPIRESMEQQKRISAVSVMTVLFFLAFCVLVNNTWPQGAEVLRKLLFTNDFAVTGSALNEMAEQLGVGERFVDVFVDFRHQLQQIREAGR